jgi:cytochrome c oxidase subunit II
LVPVAPATISDTAQRFSSLLDLYLVVTLAGGAVTALAILFAVLRFRARTGRAPSRGSPSKIVYAVWVAILVVSVGVLSVSSIRAENKVDPVSSHPDLRLRVMAAQWKWTFIYPGGVRSQNLLVVPAGSTVEFTLRSADVIHSMWIPEMRFKRYAFPDRDTRFDLVFDHEGTFDGVCSQFCGFDHTGMVFTTRVVSKSAYTSWLANGGGAP